MPSVLSVLNITSSVSCPLHTTWLGTSLTWAVGFTIIVKVSVGPSHEIPSLVNVGVTIIVAVSAVVPAVAVKLGIFPVPDAAKLIAVLLFVQV